MSGGNSSNQDRDALRNALLARIAEAVSEADLDEFARGLLSIAREEFGGTRAELFHSPAGDGATASIAIDTTPGQPEAEESAIPDRAALHADRAIASKGSAGFQLSYAISAAQGEAWVIVVSRPDEPFSDSEAATLEHLGRIAALRLRSTPRDANEFSAANLDTILDNIPEPAAMYDAEGKLVRISAAAASDRVLRFDADTESRLRIHNYRTLDGTPLTVDEVPVARALAGEPTRGEFLVADPATSQDRIYYFSATPVRDDSEAVIGAVLLASDVTEQRRADEMNARRREVAEWLSNFSFSLVSRTETSIDFESAAQSIAQIMSCDVFIYLYSRRDDELHLAGASVADRKSQALVEYIRSHPPRPGETFAGAAFQSGKPVVYGELSQDEIFAHVRTGEEGAAWAALGAESVAAFPTEAYDRRIGALVVTSPNRNRFSTESVQFLRVVAERLGAAEHAQRMTTIALERHRVAEDLAAREAEARMRLEAVLETAPVGIAVVSADELRFEIANESWLRFARRASSLPEDAQLVGMRVVTVLPDLVPVLRRVAEEGTPHVEEEIEVEAPDGPRYYTRIVSVVRGRLSGTTQNLTVLVQDVTEEVRARRELAALAQIMEERSARLDSILGSMTDALWVYDIGGKVIDVNESALRIFGFQSRAEAMSQGDFTALSLRHRDGRPLAPDEMPLQRALRGEVVPDFPAIATHLMSENDIDISIAAAPVESRSIVGAVLVIRDITALQELDRKKDEFLSVASHELRTPLTTIRGYTQLQLQLANDCEWSDRSSYLKASLGEIDRMMGLVSDLLDVSRIETNRVALHRQEIDWLAFLRQQVEHMRVQNASRRIELHVATDAARVSGDPARLRQVMDNLVTNSLKYSPEQYPVVIRVERNKDWIDTSVSDRGIGIPSEEIKSLFDRFHRASNVSSRYYSGLGLGLYIVKAIVEAHQGSIEVSSEEGHGSTFTLRLPVPKSERSSARTQ